MSSSRFARPSYSCESRDAGLLFLLLPLELGDAVHQALDLVLLLLGFRDGLAGVVEELLLFR
jgi:hypothetical protein